MSAALTILGGLGIFLFGLRIMSDGLQRIAGSRLRAILAGLTRNRFAGIFSGFVDTDAELVGVEPAGGAAVGGGVPGVVHGMLSYLKQDEWGQVQDLMGACVFLASRAADYVNGHVLAVDGGYLVR